MRLIFASALLLLLLFGWFLVIKDITVYSCTQGEAFWYNASDGYDRDYGVCLFVERGCWFGDNLGLRWCDASWINCTKRWSK